MTEQNRTWQVWIDGQHRATVELEMWRETSAFQSHIQAIAGTRDVELVLDAWAKGTLRI